MLQRIVKAFQSEISLKLLMYSWGPGSEQLVRAAKTTTI